MKNEHWIQGDNLCEAPLFRRSFVFGGDSGGGED